MLPTDELMQEHQIILSMLHVLTNICKQIENKQVVPRKDLVDMLYFLKVFADANHHGKEENHLFPAMGRAGIPTEGGPIGMMLAEHTLGRQHIANMSAAMVATESDVNPTAYAEHARKYINLLTLHIQKEDNILYPIADSHLSDEEQETIRQGFIDTEVKQLTGKRELLDVIIEDLKKSYTK